MLGSSPTFTGGIAERGPEDSAVITERGFIGSPRADALAALAPHLAQMDPQELYPLWRETLPVLAARPRKELLANLKALVPVIHALGGREAIAETFRAIQDVGRWWP